MITDVLYSVNTYVFLCVKSFEVICIIIIIIIIIATIITRDKFAYMISTWPINNRIL